MIVFFSIWLLLTIVAVIMCLVAKEKEWKWVIAFNLVPILGQLLIIWAFFAYRKIHHK